MSQPRCGPTGQTPAQDGAISGDSVVVAAERQVSSALGDGTVILDLEEGVYYGLDPVGTSIWDLLQQPRQVREIRERIVLEYDVDSERCERDLCALLEELVARGLVETRAAGAEPT